MSYIGLLEDCQSYLQQAQASWDKYFTKWEALAEEENKNDRNVFLPYSQVETSRVPSKRGSARRQLRNKSISILNRKRFKSSLERKAKCKRGRVQGGKARDRKRETEIIHTTENQTNLECEDLNNKHFEGDFKMVFIEILSESAKKMGMFSVLSKTFSVIGEAINNFSFGSMIMGKNGFSISPVSKTVLHSAFSNECRLEGIPCGKISNAAGQSCVNVTEHRASNVHFLRTRHLPEMKEKYINMNILARKSKSFATNYAYDVNHECEDISRPLLTNGGSVSHLNPQNPVCSSSEINREKDGDPADYLSSPDETLRKIIQSSSTVANFTKRCSRKNIKRRKTKLCISESSEEDREEDESDGSPEKLLKIFSTPKTRHSRRSNRHDNDGIEAVIEDDDNSSFLIFDRVKTDKH